MAERKTGPKEVVLLKRWEDWSDGIGHLVDEPRVNGMYYASGILGLKRELRPAPFFTTVTSYESAWRDPDSSTKAFAFAVIAHRPASDLVAIEFDATATGSVTGNTTLTYAHTVGTIDNTYLLVGVSATGGTDPSGVTYNSVAMTKITSGSSNSTVNVSIWGLAAPTTGANNIVVTFAGSVDMVGGSVSYHKAEQAEATSTFFNTEIGTTGTAPSPYMVNAALRGNGILFAVSADNEATNTDIGADETSRWQTLENSAVRGVGSTRTPRSGYQPHYFVEEPATSSSTTPFLYIFRGNASNDTILLKKLVLSNTDFALDKGEHEFTTLTQPGQPARYQGKWHFPAAGTTLPRELTTVGTETVSTDTLTGPTGSGGSANAEHLTNVAFQLAGHRSGSGVRILILDGDPQTEANWGSYFQVGDKDERALGLKGLSGLTFVLSKEGLYSFNSKGRAGLVFEDFRSWRDVFDNLPMSAWRGGLIISHPSGLLFFIPGEQPINIGVDAKQGVLTLPPAGPTEIHGGRYHSTGVAGDFIYTTYQPVVTSSEALLLVAYPKGDDPTRLTWQSIGSVTLNDAAYLSGTYVSVNSLPLSGSSSTPRPVLWVGHGSELKFTTLDPRASPFRSRADTHRINTAADAYMSEIIFPEPVDITEVLVYTQDMADGDEWQLSAFYDDEDADVNFGTPFISNGKDDRKLDLKKVTRFMLHVNWVGTSTSDRVPPTIKKIELFGRPSSGR